MLPSAKVVPDSVPIGHLIHPTHWPPAPPELQGPKRQHPGVDNPGHRQPRRQSLQDPVHYLIHGLVAIPTSYYSPLSHASLPARTRTAIPPSRLPSHPPTPPEPSHGHHPSSSSPDAPFPHPNNGPSFLLSTLRLSICRPKSATTPLQANPHPGDLPKASYNPDTPCTRQVSPHPTPQAPARRPPTLKPRHAVPDPTPQARPSRTRRNQAKKTHWK